MLSDLTFKSVYGPTSAESALNNFLIPALAQAVQYQRVAGYFSSTVFAEAASGISGLVSNGGRMQLVTSHVISEWDGDALLEMESEGSTLEKALREFSDCIHSRKTLEDRMKSDYVQAMCWMLREDLLEIRLVVPDQQSKDLHKTDFEKFHPKFGVITDFSGEEVVFSGSINETRLGWVGNIENLSVYRGWDSGVRAYCEAYKEQFSQYWSGKAPAGWKMVSLPEAIREGLVRLSPPGAFPDLSEWEEVSNANDSSGSHRSPRAYQLDALKAWESNNRVGLLEMATGTGKTFTAKLCLDSAKQMGSLLTVVVAPYQHICDQWAAELNEEHPVQVGSSGNWRDEITTLLMDCKLGLIDNLTLVVVKNTASSTDFEKRVNELASCFDNFLFIGDEVHWLGARAFQRSLNPNANFRLGLSATPERYFDGAGSDVLRDYFGQDPVFAFGLAEALAWPDADGTTGVLAPYEYWPIFVRLTPEEHEDYQALSKLIAQKSANENATREDQEEIERLLNKRADIAKMAANKLPALASLLEKLGPKLDQCLIYCAESKQMEGAMEVARNRGIDSVSRITSMEKSSKSDYFLGLSEREHILQNFAKGNIGVLFAIQCLDEGVDIPSARIGIILASSGNPKEFIQRRGRLMRKSPKTGKTKAVIYDMVVLHEDGSAPDSLKKIELKRVAEFANLALNKGEIEEMILEIGAE